MPPPAGRAGAHRAGGRRYVLVTVMAVLAVVALVAAGTVVGLRMRQGEAGPDPYAGAYPTYSPTPTPTAAWTPSGPAAGPLRRFPGRPSKVIGQVVDKQAGLAYSKLAAPWQPIKGFGSSTAGFEYTVDKPKFQWYGTVSSEPLDRRLAPIATGPNRLRAAAELSAAQWAKEQSVTKLTPIAGQAMRVSGRQAWLAGYRATITGSASGINERIVVMVAVDTGRAQPGVLQAMVGQPKYAMLPDVNTAVTSLRVVR